MQKGPVSSRVALSLRSAEGQPYLCLDFIRQDTDDCRLGATAKRIEGKGVQATGNKVNGFFEGEGGEVLVVDMIPFLYMHVFFTHDLNFSSSNDRDVKMTMAVGRSLVDKNQGTRDDPSHRSL